MSDTLFDLTSYTRQRKSSFFDYEVDVGDWEDIPRTPNSQFRTPNSEPQTPNSQLRTPNSEPLTPNSELPTPNSSSWLSVSEIRRDGGTQPRAFLDLKHVATLVEVLEDGGELDPVMVFYDGDCYWLADGFHRCRATEDFGQEEINCTITQGTRRDAVLFSVGANASHKAVKPRSREDKRRAVTMLLNDPEWQEWSDREIARQCKVSQPFVSALKKNLTDNVISEKQGGEVTYTSKHGTTTKMHTGNIGRGETKQKPKAVDNHSEPRTPNSELPAPPPSTNDYLIGFVSNIDNMSVGQLEEAQRRIEQRLNRQSEVNKLLVQVEALTTERDQFKTEVEAIATERDAYASQADTLTQQVTDLLVDIEVLQAELEALKTHPAWKKKTAIAKLKD